MTDLHPETSLDGLVAELSWCREKLDTLPAIEQAKGLLMAVYGIGPATAFQVLIRWSQHSNTKLHTIAATLVAAASSAPTTRAGENVELLGCIQQLSRRRSPERGELLTAPQAPGG